MTPLELSKSRCPRQFDAIVKMVKGRMDSGAVSAGEKGHLLWGKGAFAAIGEYWAFRDWGELQWEVG